MAHGSRVAGHAAAWAFVVMGSGCGGRTAFDAEQASEIDGAPLLSGAPSGPAEDAGLDPCPAAVPAGAGRPMTDNCSTRDGRSRVAGPSSPHVRWARQAPGTPMTYGGLSADASGSVYLATSASAGAASASLVRFDGSTGTIAWTQSIASSGVPALLLASGVYVYQPTLGAPDFAQVDPSTGVASGRTIPLSDGTPAVGSDGSFYGYNGDSGLAVARSTPDGRIAWQSGDLSQGTGSGNVVALGPGDLVLDTISFPNGAPWAVIALDPATGAERWRYAQAQPGVVSPARVRPDGSIAVQSMGGPSNQLLILESTGTLRATIDLGALGATSAQLSAVNADGSFLLADLSTIFKVTASGELAWMSPAFAEPEGVLYAARGRVIVADGAFLKGLSPATGEVAWTVPLVSASGGVKDMTLASGGAIVVLQGDGTLFGASD
jgi:hypothetical protein